MSLFSVWVTFFTVMFAVTSALMILRLVLRYKSHRFGTADWLTAFCLLLSTIMYAIAIWAGYIDFTIPGAPYKASFKEATTALDIYEMIAVILVPLSKCCVSLLLLEVEPNRTWRRALIIFQYLILAVGLVNTVMSFFGCYILYPGLFWSAYTQTFVPMAKNQLNQRVCVVRKQWIPLNGVLNVLFEIAILVWATSLVSRMKSTGIQRVGLAITFGLGLFTMAATVMSTYVTFYNYEWESHHFDTLTLAEQYHWAGIWVSTDAYTSLIVGSILPIRATLSHFFGRIVGSIRHHNRVHTLPGESDTTLAVSINDKGERQQEEDGEFEVVPLHEDLGMSSDLEKQEVVTTTK